MINSTPFLLVARDEQSLTGPISSGDIARFDGRVDFPKWAALVVVALPFDTAGSLGQLIQRFGAILMQFKSFCFN